MIQLISMHRCLASTRRRNRCCRVSSVRWKSWRAPQASCNRIEPTRYQLFAAAPLPEESRVARPAANRQGGPIRSFVTCTPTNQPSDGTVDHLFPDLPNVQDTCPLTRSGARVSTCPQYRYSSRRQNEHVGCCRRSALCDGRCRQPAADSTTNALSPGGRGHVALGRTNFLRPRQRRRTDAACLSRARIKQLGTGLATRRTPRLGNHARWRGTWAVVDRRSALHARTRLTTAQEPAQRVARRPTRCSSGSARSAARHRSCEPAEALDPAELRHREWVGTARTRVQNDHLRSTRLRRDLQLRVAVLRARPRTMRTCPFLILVG